MLIVCGILPVTTPLFIFEPSSLSFARLSEKNSDPSDNAIEMDDDAGAPSLRTCAINSALACKYETPTTERLRT